jgi:arsenate reductase (thioredoxin)
MFNILILCTGNSARSIIAEAIFNREGHGKFKAFSAGSFPKGKVNRHALKLLERLGFETNAFRSKSWDEFSQAGSPLIHFVITVCDNAANEICPVWIGHPMTTHWGIPDPAEVVGTEAYIESAFQLAYERLHRRIVAFIATPIAELDKLSLQNRIHEIGRTND